MKLLFDKASALPFISFFISLLFLTIQFPSKGQNVILQGSIDALKNNTTGNNNTAGGFQVLMNNKAGEENTGYGYKALFKNTNGVWNTANGVYALYSNINGNYNTSVGLSSLYSNTRGDANTAIGNWALYSDTSGSYNTANGVYSLHDNKNGDNNTAIGYEALYSNEKGNNNLAVGYDAGYWNAGSSNVFIGYMAGYEETGSNKLYIHNSSGTPLIYGDFSKGNIGIKTTNPLSNLSIDPAGIGSKITLWDGGNPKDHFGFGISADQLDYHVIGTNCDHVFYAGGRYGPNGQNTELFRVKGNGKVSIGNGSMNLPEGYKLYVQTGILTEKLTLAAANSTKWADYVFDKQYNLKPLSDVEEYIKTYKHLPNIPSTEEVKRNGIDIADINAKFLEKIEELYLHVIQLEKKNTQLETKIKELESKN